MTRRIGTRPAALWAVWLATRTVFYLVDRAPRMSGDVGIYQHWYSCCLSHGAFPVADPMWQYPPGAALVFWLPGRLPGGYLNSFVLLAMGCDLAITLMLSARARRGGSWTGAWYWVCGAAAEARYPGSAVRRVHALTRGTELPRPHHPRRHYLVPCSGGGRRRPRTAVVGGRPRTAVVGGGRPCHAAAVPDCAAGLPEAPAGEQVTSAMWSAKPTAARAS